MKKIDITEKKINYKVADIIFLLALFVILIPFQKYAFRNGSINEKKWRLKTNKYQE